MHGKDAIENIIVAVDKELSQLYRVRDEAMSSFVLHQDIRARETTIVVHLTAKLAPGAVLNHVTYHLKEIICIIPIMPAVVACHQCS